MTKSANAERALARRAPADMCWPREASAVSSTSLPRKRGTTRVRCAKETFRRVHRVFAAGSTTTGGRDPTAPPCTRASRIATQTLGRAQTARPQAGTTSATSSGVFSRARPRRRTWRPSRPLRKTRLRRSLPREAKEPGWACRTKARKRRGAMPEANASSRLKHGIRASRVTWAATKTAAP